MDPRDHHVDLPEEEFVNSSVTEISQFLESPIWADFRQFLEKERIEAHLESLQDKDLTIEELRYKQGIIAACKDMLDLPEMLMELAHQQEEYQDGS